MQLHVSLVCAGVVILSPASLAPVGFCLLEGTLDLCVEKTVGLGGRGIECDCKDVWLNAKLDCSASLVIVVCEGALGALVATGGAARDV